MTLLDEQLIPQFVQSFYSAQAAVETGDRSKALAAYQDLLLQYKQIASSTLERAHKELAHRQVQSVYAGLAGLPVKTSLPVQDVRSLVTEPGFLSSLGVRDYVTVGVFAVLIMLVLFFKPEYIGLAAYEGGNAPPQWVGATASYAAQVGVPLTIPLDVLFRDPEGDSLVFLATSAPGIDVSVSDSQVTLFASDVARGTNTVVVMASDLVSITKVPLTISVT